MPKKHTIDLASKSELSWLEHGIGAPNISAFNQQPYLAFNLCDLPNTVDPACFSTISQPVIGVGASTEKFADYCDLVVQADQNINTIIANITEHPQTAAILVQTLRATESASNSLALKIESLAYATAQSGSEYRNWLAARPPDTPTPATESGPAVILNNDGGHLQIELNRASRRNAISIEMRDALCEAFELVCMDPSIEKVSIKGRGACFSVGGDLEEFGQTPDPLTGHLVRSMRLPAAQLVKAAKTANVTAHVHSACIGAGIELPAFADTVIAQADAFFQLPEITFGLIPGAGGCVSLVRRIGRLEATKLCLSGKRINADEALKLGLIDQLVDA